jgi:hypothetical protein
MDVSLSLEELDCSELSGILQASVANGQVISVLELAFTQRVEAASISFV